MKVGELIDVAIDEPKSQLIVELHNGQRIATNSYYHSEDKSGNPVIVIKAGRKIAKN